MPNSEICFFKSGELKKKEKELGEKKIGNNMPAPNVTKNSTTE